MKWKVVAAVLAFVVMFYFQILGMMNLAPLYITTPLLFFVIFVIMLGLNNRNRFRGFKG
ncbi:hypothetical protein [Bacillus suaedaesalsae]|uniref:Uncharacterized protein n=1 Tax=Bacillus suaedaesalsae TaxID=2810349 RepID=A0ABS2DIE7_9BACI|nr:hypothetical protein [Bacillus suaedaesalsae]MBM6618264.1 hypothetical protein [Bacillus suaedaesalsae]